ncbi:hypothetical protein GPECTOR_3g468 [Gonium pectorale]|uniref:Uncharacterized protein n=1 Tax=Gonium pectorale TaxID=33097 RepID=A0A150GZJ5_GONPE|nr:hypothetical protein GPECTOR_3g468 [Gonium pectorale]|eukprot:KXZ55336.1 hypothetical protein GPECTOR_3g468 [Gonium pectorale]
MSGGPPGGWTPYGPGSRLVHPPGSAPARPASAHGAAAPAAAGGNAASATGTLGGPPAPPPFEAPSSPSVMDFPVRNPVPPHVPGPSGQSQRPTQLPPLYFAAGPRLSHSGIPSSAGGGSAASGSAGAGAALPHPVDKMALVNALPTLRHCPTMPVVDAALGMGMGLGFGENGERLDGGSPVATAAVLEEAMLNKAMSANEYVLELLQHQATLTRMLDQEG